MKPWSTEDAKELYGISRWSDGYFSVNNEGNVCVHPKRDRKRVVDIFKLMASIEQKHEIYPPMLLRFPNVLEDRIARIHTAFRDAIDLRNYEGQYNCVFPIKVNQQRQVVNDVLSFGKRWHMGLEVGSKPELLIAMAIVDDPDTPIICNGFKDEEYVEAVVLTAKMGRKIILVVEQFRELRLLAKQAAKHNTKPAIGIRVKLSTRGAGKWEDSGGEKSAVQHRAPPPSGLQKRISYEYKYSVSKYKFGQAIVVFLISHSTRRAEKNIYRLRTIVREIVSKNKY